MIVAGKRDLNVLARMVQAILGAVVVLGLHGWGVWILLASEANPAPPNRSARTIQASLLSAPVVAPEPEAAPPPKVVAPPKIETPPPKMEAPPPPKVAKAAPKPKPKSKPKPRRKPRVQAEAQPPTPASAPPSAPAALATPPPAARASAPTATTVVTPPSFNAAYLHNPAPKYPRASRRRQESGKVLLRVKVSRQGRPLEIVTHRSSGFSRLDNAARKTVARWRFVPAKQGDNAIEDWVIVPIEFTLR